MCNYPLERANDLVHMFVCVWVWVCVCVCAWMGIISCDVFCKKKWVFDVGVSLLVVLFFCYIMNLDALDTVYLVVMLLLISEMAIVSPYHLSLYILLCYAST